MIILDFIILISTLFCLTVEIIQKDWIFIILDFAIILFSLINLITEYKRIRVLKKVKNILNGKYDDKI